MSPLRVVIENGAFRDDQGRQVVLRGINVAGDAKLPSHPNQPSHVSQDFFDGDRVNFHERPFTVEESHIHFSRLKQYGFNTIRYVFTWEAIESAGPGIYDEDWIQHNVRLLRIAKKYGFYVIMDPHQDVWSRYCGGSGAPMWTVYACGLDPRSFAATEAAVVQNSYAEPENFPKMIWSTNYIRLATATIFTMFFAGRHFAPKCIIDGINIQDYLQNHFISACAHLARRIHEAGGLENDLIIGWESFNEPSRGMIGWQDISVLPSDQPLRKGTCPTFWQAILTGSGRACEVDTWDIGGLGPYKSGRVLVDPQGVKAWLMSDYNESRYSYKRDCGWKLGECIWAQHGVWEPATNTLLRKDYFSRNPETGQILDFTAFTNTYFMEHYRKYRDAIRSIHQEAILCLQPPILELPPEIKNSEDDDPNMVYSPHFYDGITMMTKKWNGLWGVDVIGCLRGRYYHPVFAIKLGETAIRNCLLEQLTAIRKEGQDRMGNHPCMLTEFGIPYDMDGKLAYQTGNYSSQRRALDANYYAAEGSAMDGYCLWNYVASNNHKWGDNWNGEDCSIFSIDDRPQGGSLIKDGNNESCTENRVRSFRAAEAVVRPVPTHVAGTIVKYGFSLTNCEFTLIVLGKEISKESDEPTAVFLPIYHFPRDQCSVQVSSGKWDIVVDDKEDVSIQTFHWWHAGGKQTLRIIGQVQI